MRGGDFSGSLAEMSAVRVLIPYSVLKSLGKFSYRRHVPPSWFLCLLLTLSTSPGDTREENKEHIREVFFVVRDTRSKD